MSRDADYNNLRYKDSGVYCVVDESSVKQQKAAKGIKECRRKICIWRVATTIASIFVILLVILGVTFYFIKCKKQDRTGLREFNVDICVKTGIPNEVKCSYCEKHWIFYSGHCYFLSKQQLNWTNSQNNCKNKSSQLVVVKNAEEEGFIEKLVKQNTWIGLSRNDNDAWIWEDGSMLEGKGFWEPDEPNDSGDERCVELFPFDNVNGWNDENCSSEGSSICKRPADTFRTFYSN